LAKGVLLEMIAALLVIAAILISALVVRIGAVAFEMTGLDRDKASFQALSCFSGTGFTTREAELIAGNHYRRRIASVLMIFGNAGLVTVITTFVVSARGDMTASLRNLAIITAGVVLVILLLKQQRIMGRVSTVVEGWLRKRTDIDAVDVVEILHQTEGYGIASLRVDETSPVANMSISTSGLRARDILILSIERSGAMIPLPAADRTILPRDSLICYGQLRAIRGFSKTRAVADESGVLE
jgi:hypothetical protein